MISPWHSLESLPGQSAVPMAWRRRLGADFPLFQAAFLQPEPEPVTSYPCPFLYGLPHQITYPPDGSIVAVCRVEGRECQDVTLAPEDIVAWELSWSKLGRALAKALSLDHKPDNLNIYNTHQIGSWSADAIPVILTIQTERSHFQNTVAKLLAHLRQKLILLAPTGHLVDATSLQLLANFGAVFFPLESTAALQPNGTVQPLTPPAHLFAQFTPPHPSTNPSIQKSTPHSALRTPQYSLRKGLGVWHLTFDGKDAVLKHERGIFYVAWLLHNPPEHPIHAIDLMAKIPEIYRHQLGLPPLVDQSTGKVAPLLSGARIQERSLALDDAEAMRALLRKERELEAILDSEDETEPVKQEALRELEAIADFQRHHSRRTTDSAQRAARTVRQSITRLHQHLASALDQTGKPHPILRPFAVHLEKHLILPSARYCIPAATTERRAPSGCFTYEPPPGCTWPA